MQVSEPSVLAYGVPPPALSYRSHPPVTSPAAKECCTMVVSLVIEKLSIHRSNAVPWAPSWNDTFPVVVVQSAARGSPAPVGHVEGVKVNATCCGVAEPSRATLCPNASGYPAPPCMGTFTARDA